MTLTNGRWTTIKPIMFSLHLVDTNADVVEEWATAFRQWPEVEVVHANILDVAANTIVSPANSYGFMDGGIDALYIEYFGIELQNAVLNAFGRRADGQLPVGNGVVVPTNHARIPYLLAAPTMTLPGSVPDSNVYWAMSAVLKTAERHPNQCRSVYCPGLATGTGRVPPRLAAERMAEAFEKWKQRIRSNST
jgi:O-acetyl-ADP-ribose deacetylase (regulator of RNase III)